VLQAERGYGTLPMLLRTMIGAAMLAAALTAGARAQEPGRYPDLNGQWAGVSAGRDAPWDPGKPAGAQAAPLTAEYRALFEAELTKRKARGIEVVSCLPPGLPRALIMYRPMDVAVTPEVTFMMLGHMNEFRRIYTDGRKWPTEIEPSYVGYSIGEWRDETQSGRYNVLAVETRGLAGPRSLDASGLPLHPDNETVIRERIFLDPADPDLLHDAVTVIDHALTGPWTVTRDYRRQRSPAWSESTCIDTGQVMLGDEVYRIDARGFLIPTRPGQPPPDMRYFQKK
jgi:hypothetical protein